MVDRVLVTGSSGFLGGHIVRRLANAGYGVDAVDIVQPTSSVPAQFIHDDARNVLAAREREYEAIFHFAAVVGGREHIDSSPLAIAANHAIDQAVFEHLASGASARVVYPSSSAVYPIDRQRKLGQPPLRESEVDAVRGPIGIPDTTYGWTKLTAEFLAGLLQARGEGTTAIYRPFSVYGPDQLSSYPVTAILERALRREDPLVIWGSGDQHRDFVYIEDFLDVVLGTYKTLDANTPMNIATGLPTSFVTVAQIAADVVGYEPRILTEPERPEGVLWRVGSPDSIPTSVKPRTSLNDGLSRVLENLASHA